MALYSRRLITKIIKNVRFISSSRSCQRKLVLGIETSCDDTGAAVVDDEGNILGDALYSQTVIHVRNGGIIPPIARDLHKKYIHEVVEGAMKNSGVSYSDLDAIAVTVKPGLALSLAVGVNYAKELANRIKKPIIPVHHMEAHALTARMLHKIEFPFLVLLVSGGHCQLAIVDSVDKFLLLGSTIDDAPGECFDKTARRLKLTNIPECATMSGGQAIEYKARLGNPLAFNFPNPLYKYRDCNFSFAGLKFSVLKIIQKLEKDHNIMGDEIVPHLEDLCASFQHGIAKHLIKRINRGMEFCDLRDLIPINNRNIVVSGGVACNNYIRGAVKQLCNHMDFQLYCPPAHLCCDNGIMIAWNGMERLKAGVGIVTDIDSIDFSARSSLGSDMSANVRQAEIKGISFKLKMPVVEYSTLDNVENGTFSNLSQEVAIESISEMPATSLQEELAEPEAIKSESIR